MMGQRMRGEALDEAAFQASVFEAVDDVVGKQIDLGIDIISDGDQGKAGFTLYISERLSGFESGEADSTRSLEFDDFPDFMKIDPIRRVQICKAPVAWVGEASVDRDIQNLAKAVGQKSPSDVFIPSAAPGVILHGRPNEYYRTEEQYLYAVADAMRHEYRAITDAGFVLQLDAPDVPDDFHSHLRDVSIQDYRRRVAGRVEVMNHALEGIPAEQVRFHVCWGNYEGPHHRDIPLKEIIDLVLQVNAGAYVIETANPRHGHEWKVWEDVALPEGKILIPGVIDSTTNFVEHPELVAERLVRLAGIVGERTSSLGPIADLRLLPATRGSIRRSPGRNWDRWWRVHDWRVRFCGANGAWVELGALE